MASVVAGFGSGCIALSNLWLDISKLTGLSPPSHERFLAFMDAVAKPFLKWAGAKTQIIRTLRAMLPDGNRLIEPFVGSGVVFLNTRYPQNLLSDSNQDLIGLYSVLKPAPRAFIEKCQALFTDENNAPDIYYGFRQEFNACRDEVRRAVLFVYLNRHCCNGLCRYNKKGAFNTPFGRYDRVYFPADEMLGFAERLQPAELRTLDFRTALASAGQGDVVYCDPPYVPLTPTASFTSYAAGGFSQQDQRDLHALALAASKRGATVVLSNHDTSFTRELYTDASRLEPLMVSRSISCNGQNRNKAKELLAVFGQSRSDWLL